jgi:predicted TIM-barrel fold metal-dependent hydrolase
MLSRRDVLRGAAVAVGGATLTQSIPAVFASAALPRTPINFSVPPGACDRHTHIFDPQRFPYAASRPYTPETASVSDLRALHRGLHVDRVIISQPTVYGTDHSCTLDAIKQLGPDARGMAFIGENTSDTELDELQRGGMRGIVVHKTSNLKAAANRIKDLHWHIETYVRLSEIEGVKDQVAASPVPIVFTLFGGAQAAPGVHQPGIDTLLDLVRSGKAYVDFAAPDHISKQGPDFPDIAPIARAIIAANPHGVTWGTDWPHAATVQGQQMQGITPLEQIDDAISLNLLASWTSGADQLKLILVDNPARLYGF